MKYSRVGMIVWGSVAGLLALALIVRHDWVALGRVNKDIIKGAKGKVAMTAPLPVPAIVTYDQENRDPFSAAKAVPAEEKGLSLDGISWDPDNPVAVIDDEVVGVGGEVAGHKVLSITPHEVVLSDGLKEVKLTLPMAGGGL